MDNEIKYKELVGKIKKAYLYAQTDSTKAVLEDILPELKVSEDEMIRKDLIEWIEEFPDSIWRGHYKKDVIAWLEKQEEQHPIMYVPSREVILSIWDLGNEWKELTNGCISTEHGTQLDYIQKHWQESEYYLREMQAEQKTVDKIEPKFHEGDFIKHNKANIICKVISVNKGSYYVENIETSGRIELFNAEQNFHIWTIQDAKDGDVLWHSDTASKGIFIFKEIRYDGKVLCYCDYDSEDHFCLGEHHTCCWSNDKYIKPATKEQRDTLMKAMADAGYTFDFDKKELKKIEQKSDEWSKEDKEMFDYALDMIEWYSGKNENRVRLVSDWLKSIKQRIGGSYEVH